MELPDGRKLVTDDGIRVEPPSGDGRLILWIPGARAAGFQHWDRVSTTAGFSVSRAGGLAAVPAALTPTRRRLGPRFPRLFGTLFGGKVEPSWTLPQGGICVRSGSRQTDLILAWCDDEPGLIDEPKVRTRWPGARSVRRLGPNLALIDGIEPERDRGTSRPSSLTELPPAIPARELAAHALAEARQSGDRSRVVTSLVDLAVTYLHRLDAQPAFSLLQEALIEARRLEDPARMLDVSINHAQAVSMLGRLDEAVASFEAALADARALGDRHAEKLVLERLGLTQLARGDQRQALEHFDQALGIARSVGDTHHESVILWYGGIAFAELGRPDRAIALAESTINLLRRMRKPQAEQYAQQLHEYRTGGVATTPEAVENFNASVISVGPESNRPGGLSKSDPGILLMALTATKAVAGYVGSGFKTVSSDTYRARMAVCSKCEMFTGVRCRVCACISSAKARLPYEDCPTRKWPA